MAADNGSLPLTENCGTGTMPRFNAFCSRDHEVAGMVESDLLHSASLAPYKLEIGPHSAQTGSGTAGMVGFTCGAAASTVTVGAAAAGTLSLLLEPMMLPITPPRSSAAAAVPPIAAQGPRRLAAGLGMIGAGAGMARWQRRNS